MVMANTDTGATPPKRSSGGGKKEDLKITGKVDLVLKDSEGRVKKSATLKNLVVTDGKDLIAGLLAQDGSSFPSHMAVGDSDTSPTAGQSALQGSELGRVALNSTTTQNGNEVVYNATFPDGTATGTVEEMGIFNFNSGGTMLCRVLTGTFDKGSNDSLEISWTLTVG
jgi:hypothetical protein